MGHNNRENVMNEIAKEGSNNKSMSNHETLMLPGRCPYRKTTQHVTNKNYRDLCIKDWGINDKMIIYP